MTVDKKRVKWLCDRYESGFGHGIKADGLDASKTPHGDDKEADAFYQEGYEMGLLMRKGGMAQ